MVHGFEQVTSVPKKNSPLSPHKRNITSIKIGSQNISNTNEISCNHKYLILL
jgi:hypothetical protein